MSTPDDRPPAGSRYASEVAILPSGPNQSSAMLCSRKATANVATSITAGECPRSGRKTSQSIATESASTTAKQRTIPAHDRPAPLRGERECERPGHHELPVGEVDEPEHAEDEADPDRHQRVHRSEEQAVGQVLPACTPSREVRRHELLGVACVLRGRASAAARRSRARGCGRRPRPCAGRAARRAAPRSRAP